MQVKNNSTEAQAITGIPAFAPGEVRDLDEATAKFVLGNPNFSEVKGNLDKEERNDEENKNLKGIEEEDTATGVEEEEEKDKFRFSKKKRN